MEKEAREKFEEYRNKDPYPDIAPALLNNADTKKYINTAGIIDPFYEKDLNGITYDVRLEGRARYWHYNDKHPGRKEKKDIYVIQDSKPIKDLNTEKLTVVNQIELQPNSITYVTLEPFFRMPAYIVARFNLKINLVYKGLLLGTGPIIDPCFEGRLSIPLHNLTHNSYTFFGGDRLIAMEFTKTSQNIVWDQTRTDDEQAKSKYFSGGNTYKRDVYYYINNALLGNKSNDIVNASVRYSTFVKGLKSSQKWDRTIIIGSITAFIILIVSLLVPISTAFKDIQKDRIEYQERQYRLERHIATLEQKISGITNTSAGIESGTKPRDNIVDSESAVRTDKQHRETNGTR
jgi:deoxycytidine triphosphate deaminase